MEIITAETDHMFNLMESRGAVRAFMQECCRAVNGEEVVGMLVEVAVHGEDFNYVGSASFTTEHMHWPAYPIAGRVT